MQTGDVIAGRFVIEHEAGAGGMGTVFRAIDRDGSAIAVKVLHARGPREVERFLREAQLLAELDHPHVVRHVATGTTPEGDLYLAMEWLEGLDLDARLQQGALTPSDALTMLRGVCEGLAVAHRRGVIHRDIKPSNLFLVGGDVAKARLIDFGVARRAVEKHQLTGTGALVGTPAYMAPEQARGAHAITPAVDVFALGCVLFEALAARPAFVGENLMAVLAKVLLEDAPALGEIVPSVPRSIEALVARMLDKEPSARPANASEVITLLATLTTNETQSVSVRPPSLTSAEQRIVSVVLAGHAAPVMATDVAATLPVEPASESLLSKVRPFGGRLESLADGTIVALLAGEGTPIEHAARAAQCALALRRALPDAPMVLATGRGVVAGRLPTGAVIDRAVALLRRGASKGTIRIDENTAGLVDRRFDVAGDGGGLVLRGERDLVETARTVLGRSTPCLGRERELASLESLLTECIEEPVARAALVTAPAGTGKSRLLQEFTSRVLRRTPLPDVLVGRGDSSAAGSPFALFGSMIRRACLIDESEPLEVRRLRVRARIGRHVPASDAARVSAFLGEIAGVAFDASEVPALASARADAQIMGDAIMSALLDWLGAECREQPVVVVLDDLHWGDLPSVRLIDAALRVLKELPLLVVALARPEVHASFPSLWTNHDPTEIRLPALTRKNAERLVREVLGAEVDTELVARIVDRSEGNAFFLEEIVRAIGARGAIQAIPDTVLGMVQARFDTLDESARRALRAASVFGERFWRAGVEQLRGDRVRAGSDWISVLLEREMVVAVPEARLDGESGYQFRHALVRDAAYAMLTDADRVLGHRLAGEWLLAAGETDAASLGRHFELGQDAPRAVEQFSHAALQALEGGDLESALTWVRRAVELGAQGEQLGRLRLTEAEAHHWRANYVAQIESGRSAEANLRPGTRDWYRALGHQANGLGQTQRMVELGETLARISTTDPEAGHVSAQLANLARGAIVYVQINRLDPPAWLRGRVEALLAGDAGRDPIAAMQARQVIFSPLFGQFDVGLMIEALLESMEEVKAAGDLRLATHFGSTAGFLMTEVGDFERAEPMLRACVAQADRLGTSQVAAIARHNLGYVLMVAGRLDESHEVQLRALETFQRIRHTRLEAASHVMLAREALAANDFHRVETHARTAIEIAVSFPQLRVDALATLADALRGRGELQAAREAAMDSVKLQTAFVGRIPRFGAWLALAQVERAAGDDNATRIALSDGLLALERAAEAIANQTVRRTFVSRHPFARAMVAFARECNVALPPHVAAAVDSKP